jgi:hypothetical protein
MTFVSYPNISTTSENGEFRVDIVGIETDEFFRDRANFTYRSFHRNQLVWEWKPEAARQGLAFLDDYPHEAWISNDGWVVVRTHEWFHAGLLVVSPRGEVVTRQSHQNLTAEGEPGFLDAEPEQFMGDSSAGPFWSRSSLAYFSEMFGRQCWTIRTWWGRRVTIDLQSGKFLDPGTEDASHAESIERSIVLTSLVEGLRRVQAEAPSVHDDTRRFWSIARPVLAAAYHAGQLNSVECIPLLRELEEIDLVGSETSVEWASVERLPFRETAKLSLLRLSQEPKWQSHYRFQVRAKRNVSDERELFEFPTQPMTRDHTKLELGLDQKQVLHLIGAPDYIRTHWDYDFIAGGKEFTVRISWDESHLPAYPTGQLDREAMDRFYEEYRAAVDANPPRIAGIQVIPPQWREITMRDHKVV